MSDSDDDSGPVETERHRRHGDGSLTWHWLAGVLMMALGAVGGWAVRDLQQRVERLELYKVEHQVEVARRSAEADAFRSQTSRDVAAIQTSLRGDHRILLALAIKAGVPIE